MEAHLAIFMTLHFSRVWWTDQLADLEHCRSVCRYVRIYQSPSRSQPNGGAARPFYSLFHMSHESKEHLQIKQKKKKKKREKKKIIVFYIEQDSVKVHNWGSQLQK